METVQQPLSVSAIQSFGEAVTVAALKTTDLIQHLNNKHGVKCGRFIKVSDEKPAEPKHFIPS